MIALLVLILFGAITAIFATQNTTNVLITIGPYLLTVPMYIVILASMFFGALVAWLISLIDSAGSLVTIMGKNRTIDANERTISNLRSRVHELEIENTRLRTEQNQLPLGERIKASFHR